MRNLIPNPNLTIEAFQPYSFGIFSGRSKFEIMSEVNKLAIRSLCFNLVPQFRLDCLMHMAFGLVYDNDSADFCCKALTKILFPNQAASLAKREIRLVSRGL